MKGIWTLQQKIPKATVTRPILARILLAAGYEVTPKKSIWNPSRLEWEFDMDETSARIINDYYAEIGKRPPRMVTLFLQNQEKKA